MARTGSDGLRLPGVDTLTRQACLRLFTHGLGGFSFLLPDKTIEFRNLTDLWA